MVPQGVQAQSAKIRSQGQTIKELQQRLTRIEGEIKNFDSGMTESDVNQLIESLRVDLDSLRASRLNSPDLPLPVSHYIPDEVEDTDWKSKTVSQEFQFRSSVNPESVVIVQGSTPGFVVSVELLDENQKWIVIYEEPDFSADPASETWLENVEFSSTNRIRVTVTGIHGVEAVGVSVGEVIHWSMASD